MFKVTEDEAYDIPITYVYVFFIENMTQTKIDTKLHPKVF